MDGTVYISTDSEVAFRRLRQHEHEGSLRQMHTDRLKKSGLLPRQLIATVRHRTTRSWEGYGHLVTPSSMADIPAYGHALSLSVRRVAWP